MVPYKHTPVIKLRKNSGNDKPDNCSMVLDTGGTVVGTFLVDLGSSLLDIGTFVGTPVGIPVNTAAHYPPVAVAVFDTVRGLHHLVDSNFAALTLVVDNFHFQYSPRYFRFAPVPLFQFDLVFPAALGRRLFVDWLSVVECYDGLVVVVVAGGIPAGYTVGNAPFGAGAFAGDPCFACGADTHASGDRTKT